MLPWEQVDFNRADFGSAPNQWAENGLIVSFGEVTRTFPTCTRAREERADLLAKEILEIADAPCKDAVEVAHARNRLDTRKWLASKLAPRKYGDRVEHDHKGGLNFQPAVLVQVGSVDQPLKTISSDPHPGTLPDEE